MSEGRSRKIPVTERQFLWVQDDDKGEVVLHVGPTMVSPTAADRVVVDDGDGGFREDVSGQPQKMIEVGDNQYAVLFNPLVENDGGTNGRFKAGRNEARLLQNGTRSMIPGPCFFYLRPGQRVEVRDAHELASNQYLIVKVYGDVDTQAPYHEVTARSAHIVAATDENAHDGDNGQDLASVQLRRGQLIVIRGLDTQFYIPPTGVDIVPDTSLDESGAALGAAQARALLAQFGDDHDEGTQVRGAPRRQLADGFVDQSARARHRKMPSAPAPAGAPAAMVGAATGRAEEPVMQQLSAPAPSPSDLVSNLATRAALESQARQARLVRNAVVLGEKEYCVIVDADGKRQIRVGPARVFPGPYDTFMAVGSRNRIYDAYELLPQRALWIRVISPIAREEMARKLPRGIALDREQYYPGDELLVTGVSTFFVPFNEIEVLSPDTGQAVVGNDHGRVFIEAIGIDQKSGIYVRDLATGEVRLIRGKLSYLVDPRKEVQITRTVQPEEWNLWIAANEPHKVTRQAVTTPWALSVVVPSNTAIEVTSANARRVAEGPCVTLLGYEETLTAIHLSTGMPKNDDSVRTTVFLRTLGNQVRDTIVVETADFVQVAVHVSYSVTFDPALRERWFNHPNYVQYICDHLRSIVRSRCRGLSLSTLWPQIPAVVRDTILGEKGADGARPGRTFSDNGSCVTEVEVLRAEIEDEEVAELMHKVQTQSVKLTIGDRQAQEELVSARLRAGIDDERRKLNEQARTSDARLAELARKIAHEAELAGLKDLETVAAERQSLTDRRLADAVGAELQRGAARHRAEVESLRELAAAKAAAQRETDAAMLEARSKIAALDEALIRARSAATVAESQAIQAGLVEALTALGDKLLLGDVAKNMNLVSLVQGKDVGTILEDVLGGTKVIGTLREMQDKWGKSSDASPE